jgi:hypothetical protein
MQLSVLIIITLLFSFSSHAKDKNGNLEFFSTVNLELVHQQCKENYIAAEKKFAEQNKRNEGLLNEALKHQGVIDSILGETKGTVENAQSPFGQFVDNYFAQERPRIGSANILIDKNQQVHLNDSLDSSSGMKGAGFALGSESSDNRLSFQFRFRGNCIGEVKDCKVVPRESIVNVRVLRKENGTLSYNYELNKHAEPIVRDIDSPLSKLGFYGKESAITGRVKNPFAVQDFMSLEQRKFEAFMKKEVGEACFQYISDLNRQAPHENNPHENNPNENRPHEFKPHELGGVEEVQAPELFTGLNRHLSSGALKRQPASLNQPLSDDESNNQDAQ